ncbi:MAG TPA: tetratricopeptide repeat protein [Polyangia bacterium]
MFSLLPMDRTVVARVAWGLVVVLVPAAACTHGQATVPAASPAAVAIEQATVAAPHSGEVDREVAESKRYTGIVEDASFVRASPLEVLTRWLVYGGDRVALWSAQNRKRAGDDFSMEAITRELLAKGWAEDRAKGAAPNADLDLMVEVEQAGLMDEYVLASFARPGWTVPAGSLAKLDVPRFRSYADRRLLGHRPIRPVRFYPKDAPAYPAPPGGTLPSVTTLAPPRTSCAAGRAGLTAALAQWFTEESQLEGAPLAAADRAGFLRALEKVREVAPFAEQGATWVLPSVADLHAVAGFCAVEERRWGDAERLLAKAVSLAPLTPGPYGELALVYDKQGRLDDAERTVTRALGLDPNSCEQARLLRQQGYILIDRGKLLEALHAYGRSLELAPGNPIATKEIDIVLGEMRRRGGTDAKTAEAYRPPPQSPDVRVTSCPR